jgi:hypothetical protein
MIEPILISKSVISDYTRVIANRRVRHNGAIDFSTLKIAWVVHNSIEGRRNILGEVLWTVGGKDFPVGCPG